MLLRARVWLVPLAAALVVLVAGELALRAYGDFERRRQEVSTLERLGTLRARLEGAIGFNLQLSQGLVG